MIKKAAERCPEGTPIPSKSLVRLQFAPRNPYFRTALNFTSKIQVQYKIQRRQLRVAHPDDHYCSAQLKYLKEKAVEMKEHATLFFCDDKAKVPFGEPGAAVSTGVRGRMSIAPTTTTLSTLDHDMSKGSLVPSVFLQCKVPDTVDKSFVSGQVTTVVNDAVFETASPFRHAATLVKLMKQQESSPVLMKFTDGGTDQRNTLEAVKCAAICVFKELDLDMLIMGRCAPGHSWTNPAERVMSILNLGLQNVSLERKTTGVEATRKALKSAKSKSEIRQLAQKNPEIRPAWSDSVQEVKSTVKGRFQRLKLKEVPFQVEDPISEEELDFIKRHLRERFPELNLTKLQKVHTKKVESYNMWKEQHCRERHYNFQIKKCDNLECCLPTLLSAEELTWLPDPVLDESGAHFKSYADLKNTETVDTDRPSYKASNGKGQRLGTKRRNSGVNSPMTENDMRVTEAERTAAADGTEHVNISMCTTQTARATVTCVECRKPRVIYSKNKLSERQTVSLALVLSEYDYTCGAPILPPEHNLHQKVACRASLVCATPVEIPYYGAELGQKDICAYCGSEGAITDMELKKKFKTVLPICLQCREDGKTPFVQRSYGKK